MSTPPEFCLTADQSVTANRAGAYCRERNWQYTIRLGGYSGLCGWYEIRVGAPEQAAMLMLRFPELEPLG